MCPSFKKHHEKVNLNDLKKLTNILKERYLNQGLCNDLRNYQL